MFALTQMFGWMGLGGSRQPKESNENNNNNSSSSIINNDDDMTTISKIAKERSMMMFPPKPSHVLDLKSFQLDDSYDEILSYATVSIGILQPDDCEVQVRVSLGLMTIQRLPNKPMEYIVHVINHTYNRIVITVPLGLNQVQFQFFDKEHGLIWCMPYSGRMMAFYARFANDKEEQDMVQWWSRAAFEKRRQESLDKVVSKESDIEWMKQAHRIKEPSEKRHVTFASKDEILGDYLRTDKTKLSSSSTRNGEPQKSYMHQSATSCLSSDDEEESD